MFINIKTRISLIILITLFSFSTLSCSNTLEAPNGKGEEGVDYKVEQLINDEEMNKYQENDSNGQDLEEILKITSSTFEIIRDYLEEMEAVIRQDWSIDNKLVAFSWGKDGWDDKMYIWRVGEVEPIQIADVEDRLCKFYWSPDTNFVFADAGSSSERVGYLISMDWFKKIDAIPYVGSPLWSPDSKWIAIGKFSNVKLLPLTEWYNTVDMVLYNVLTKEIKILAEGREDFFYIPKSWDGDGRLTYLKRSILDSSSQEEIIYNYLFPQQNEAAIINNEIIITRDEVEIIIKGSRMDVSVEEAIKIRAGYKLLLHEAQQREIKLSKQEADELIENQLRDIEDTRAILPDEVLDAYGVSEKEYWEDIYPNEAVEFEIIRRLGEMLVQEAIDRGELTSNLQDGGNEYFQKYRDELVSSANIKLNQDILELR